MGWASSAQSTQAGHGMPGQASHPKQTQREQQGVDERAMFMKGDLQDA